MKNLLISFIVLICFFPASPVQAEPTTRYGLDVAIATLDPAIYVSKRGDDSTTGLGLIFRLEREVSSLFYVTGRVAFLGHFSAGTTWGFLGFLAGVKYGGSVKQPLYAYLESGLTNMSVSFDGSEGREIDESSLGMTTGVGFFLGDDHRSGVLLGFGRSARGCVGSLCREN